MQVTGRYNLHWFASITGVYEPVINSEFMWAVGLFEGEGSFDGHGSTRRLALCMTDKDVVERFCQAVGCGTVSERKPSKATKAHWKTQYIWRVGSRNHVTPLLEAMLPHLGKRRQEQAQVLLDKTPRRRARVPA